MRFDIVTIFPEMVKAFAKEGIVGRAVLKKKIIEINAVDPRNFTKDNHRTVDDRPFGGGPGMVLKAEPILKAVDSVLRKKVGKRKVKKIILSPRGKKFNDDMAKKLSKYDHIILIAGRYEGIDARVKKVLRAEEVSIGDYVLSGGELPAMVVADVVARKVPGVLGKKESLEESRVAAGEMYTRPEVLEWGGKKYKAPKVLLSGNHKEIEEWRQSKQ